MTNTGGYGTACSSSSKGGLACPPAWTKRRFRIPPTRGRGSGWRDREAARSLAPCGYERCATRFITRICSATISGDAKMAAMRPWMGTLNSLVVDCEWRSRLCATPSRDEGTVASMLLRTSLSDSAGTDFRALVATAQTLISARALMRVGFRVIDPPIRTHLHARFAMCNVGVVLTTDDLCARALSTYFEECGQRRVLKESSLAGWFSAPLAIPNLPRAI